MHLKKLCIYIPNHNTSSFTYHYIAIITVDTIYKINAKKNKYIAKPIQIILELVYNSSYDEGKEKYFTMPSSTVDLIKKPKPLVRNQCSMLL